MEETNKTLKSDIVFRSIFFKVVGLYSLETNIYWKRSKSPMLYTYVHEKRNMIPLDNFLRAL